MKNHGQGKWVVRFKTLISLLVLSIFVFFLFLVITLDGVKAQSSKFTD